MSYLNSPIKGCPGGMKFLFFLNYFFLLHNTFRGNLKKNPIFYPPPLKLWGKCFQNVFNFLLTLPPKKNQIEKFLFSWFLLGEICLNISKKFQNKNLFSIPLKRGKPFLGLAKLSKIFIKLYVYIIAKLSSNWQFQLSWV